MEIAVTQFHSSVKDEGFTLRLALLKTLSIEA